MCIIPIFRPTCIFFCLVSTLTNRRKPRILPVQVHPPRPGSQRFVENEDGGLIVAMEKLNVQNIDDLLVQFAQVNHVGRQNGWFAVWDESNKASKQIINVAEMTFRSKTSWSTKQRKHTRQRNHCHCSVRPCLLIVTDQHTVQYNSFFPCTTVEWNHLYWLMHCPVQLLLPMNHCGVEPSWLTNALPNAALFPCITVEWNHWPMHCQVQHLLPMHHSGMEPRTNALPSTTLSSHAPQWNGTADQHAAQYNSFFPCTTDQHAAQYNSFFPLTTVEWNHWPTHRSVQLFLPTHQWDGTTDQHAAQYNSSFPLTSGMEPRTNALPNTTLSSHSPQWNGTTDQHAAQYNSFFPLTTVEWNCLDWPTRCPAQLFLPTHHNGVGLPWQQCNPHWLTDQLQVTDSINSNLFFKGSTPPPPPHFLATFNSDSELRLERPNTQRS